MSIQRIRPLRDAPLHFQADASPALAQLCEAAARGRAGDARRLLDERAVADVDALDAYGTTALQYAVSNRHDAVVDLLLRAGADPDARGAAGAAPLHAAARASASARVARILVEAGADVNAFDRFGKTPLHTAAEYCRTREVSDVLLERGADPAAKDAAGDTPMHVAIRHRNIPVFRAMIDYANATFETEFLNAKDAGGLAPLHAAADARDLGFVDGLLAAGADPNVEDNDQETPLMHIAIRDDDGEEERSADDAIAAALIARGASVASAADAFGYSALHHAVNTDKKVLAQMLVRAGADSNRPAAAEGPSPLDWARRRGDADMVGILQGTLAI